MDEELFLAERALAQHAGGGERQYCGFLRRTSSKALTLKRASMMPVMA